MAHQSLTVSPPTTNHPHTNTVTNGGATSSVVAVTTQLTPKATAALASEVRRSVLSHVDVRFAALENVKDAGFEDVWNELRRLTESIQGKVTLMSFVIWEGV